MPDLVSILIPAFNAERWLGETIRSALDQTWPRKELIRRQFSPFEVRFTRY